MGTHVLDSTFGQLREEFDRGCSKAGESARTELLERLNQLFRRFRAYQNESDWVQITLDAVAPFGAEIVLYAVRGNSLEVMGSVPSDASFASSISLSDAASFKSVIETNEPVIVLRTAKEVGGVLSQGHATERASLFPISNGERVSAVLFVSGANVDMNALELMASFAGSVLARKSNSGLHSQIAVAPALVKPEPEESKAPPRSATLPAWADLPMGDRQLHIRAQRFARVNVAEMQLARPEACRAGREQGNLYLFLKREIDKARENYRRQFMTVNSMVDYLHLELVRAAEGDENKLGAEYPGRLQ